MYPIVGFAVVPYFDLVHMRVVFVPTCFSNPLMGVLYRITVSCLLMSSPNDPRSTVSPVAMNAHEPSAPGCMIESSSVPKTSGGFLHCTGLENPFGPTGGDPAASQRGSVAPRQLIPPPMPRQGSFDAVPRLRGRHIVGLAMTSRRKSYTSVCSLVSGGLLSTSSFVGASESRLRRLSVLLLLLLTKVCSRLRSRRRWPRIFGLPTGFTPLQCGGGHDGQLESSPAPPTYSEVFPPSSS